MPHPSVWSSVLPVVLVYVVVGPSVAGISALFTKKFETRYFWMFSVLFAAAAAWWVVWDVSPGRVFEQVFHTPAGAEIQGLDYDQDRRTEKGVFLFRFRTDAATAERLAHARYMEEVPPPPVATLVPEGLETPPSWPPPWLGSARTWHERSRNAGYPVVDSWLFHQAETGETRFLLVGRWD